MKTILKYYLVFLISFCAYGQIIEKSTLDSGGASVTAGNLEVVYTLGQVNVREVVVGNLSVSEGFINSELNGCQILITQVAQNLVLDFDISNDVVINNWLNNNGNASATSLACGDLIWRYNILSDNLSDTDGDETLDRLTVLIEFIAEGDFGNSATTTASIIFNDFASAGESAGNGDTICEDTYPISDFDNDLFTFPNEGVNYNDAKFNSSTFDIEQFSGAPGLQVVDGTKIKFPDTGSGQFSYFFRFDVQTTVTIGAEDRIYETSTFYTANNVTVAFDPGPNIAIDLCDFSSIDLLDLYSQLQIELDVDTSEFNEAADFGNVFEPENSWYNETDNLEANPNLPPLTEITSPGVYQFNAKAFLEDCAGEPVFVTLIAEPLPDAGNSDLFFEDCLDSGTIDLGQYVSSGADGNGSWESLDGLTIFNGSNVDIPSSGSGQTFGFLYKVLNDCGEEDQAQIDVDVNFAEQVDAGNSQQDITIGPGIKDLDNYLSNNATSGGFWSGDLLVNVDGTVNFPDTGSGQFFYSFSYAVDNGCGTTDTATFDFVVDIPADVGSDGNLEICPDAIFTETDLFNALNGTPETGGVWTPVIDGPGVYTYTIGGVSASANVTVTERFNLELDQPAQDLVLNYDGSGNEVQVNNWLNSGGGASFLLTCGDIQWDYLIINYSFNDSDFDSVDDQLVVIIEFTAFDDFGGVDTTASIIYNDFATAGISAGNGDTICDGNYPVSDLDNGLFTFPDVGADYDTTKYSSSWFEINQTSGEPGLGLSGANGTIIDFPDTGSGQFTYNFDFKVQTTLNIGSESLEVESVTAYTANNVITAFDPGPNITIPVCDFNNVDLLDLYDQLQIQKPVSMSEFNEAGVFQPENSWYNETDDLEANPNIPPLTEITAPGVYQFNAKKFLEDCAGLPVFVTIVACEIQLNLKAFLQGPYDTNTGLLNDNLRAQGFIETTSPYVDGLTCDASVFNVTGNDAIVDWVWVELRDENDNTIILNSRSALVQRDGDVVDVDGTSSLSFNSDEGNYFVAVSHRNHLGILSAQAIALNYSSATSINFTNDSNTINGGASSVKDLGNGNIALYAADFDGNGQIQNSDINGILPLLGTSFYSPADIDMNGQIQNTDINILLPNLGLGSQSGRYHQVPIPIFITAPRR